MTAEEIRKTLYDTGACHTQDAQIIVNALAEVAAQLADLNSNLKTASKEMQNRSAFDMVFGR